jgi:hypothetical protein
MLGSVLAQLVRSETSLKWPRALLQISLSALGIQFGSRARRYNISRARRSVNCHRQVHKLLLRPFRLDFG